MTKPSLSQLGDPVLRQIAEPISDLQAPWVQGLIAELMSTMLASNGVGIAAPQMGRSHQLLVVASRPNARYPHAPEMEPTVMINPRLTAHSQEIVKDWEGCLSVPGIRGLVPRYQTIEIEFTGRDGQPHRSVLTDFVARIFQHEFDHLNGLVFLDRVENTRDLMSEQEYMQRVVQPA